MVSIDAPLVRRLVASQFPRWADLPVTPVEPGGWDNRTFRLGREMSVRLPSAERYAAQVATEHQWLPRLAPSLPLPIPVPIAHGTPAEGYPWSWSVYRWLDGRSAAIAPVGDLTRLARALARFLTALRRIDATGGPRPGPRNFHRGGSLSTYDAEARGAMRALGGSLDTTRARRIWDVSLDSSWSEPPVWVHGDVSPGNLLVRGGRLSAVIDFGCLGVGDPACDLAIAWTFLTPESRRAFRAALAVDDATWRRGRGWALWKAMITLADPSSSRTGAEQARHTITAVLAAS